MARYRVKPGYCLHLPNQAFGQSGEEVELNGDLEQEVLASQGWKIEPVPEGAAKGQPHETGQVEREVRRPPKDRAIKEATAK